MNLKKDEGHQSGNERTHAGVHEPKYVVTVALPRLCTRVFPFSQ